MPEVRFRCLTIRRYLEYRGYHELRIEFYRCGMIKIIKAANELGLRQPEVAGSSIKALKKIRKH